MDAFARKAWTVNRSSHHSLNTGNSMNSHDLIAIDRGFIGTWDDQIVHLLFYSIH
jgi:hypothetical protein